MSVVLVLLGLLLLLGGGELLVGGAVRISLLARIPPAVVAVTVVAAGTSAPELVVSLTSATAGQTDLAVSNVVGSNIANIGLILGIAALVRPLAVTGNTVRLEWPAMFLATVQMHLLARDGLVDRVEGLFFVAALVVFFGYTVWGLRQAARPGEAEALAEAVGPPPEPSPRAWLGAVGMVVLALGLLVGGARSLVVGAVDIARAAGLSERVIGLTLVSVGTSLPELFTSVVASLRGRDDIAVGNVIGSNLFNVLGILGITAVIHPLPVHAQTVAVDDLWMIGLSLALFPLMWTGLRIHRWEGAVLLGAVAVYAAMLLG